MSDGRGAHLSRPLQRLAAWAARPRVMGLLLGGMLLVNLLFNLPGTPGSQLPLQALGAPIFDRMAGGYDAARVAEVWRLWGEAGRAHYAEVRLLDACYPFVYSLFFAGLLWRLLPGWPSGRAKLIWLPFAAALVDEAENSLLITLLLQYPQVDAGLVGAASLCTQGKWVLIVGTLLLTAASALLALGRRLAHQH